MFRLIDTEIEVQDAPGAPALLVPSGADGAFDEVVFGYDRDREILPRGSAFEGPGGRASRDRRPVGRRASRPIGRLLFRFYDPWSGAS
jgi:ATP-binding cassette subfamily B protein